MNFRSTLLLCLSLLASACSAAFDPEVRTGGGHIISDESPEIRHETFGYFNEDDEPVIDIKTEVIYRSLVFSVENEKFTAGAGVRFNIYRLDDDSGDSQLFETIEDRFIISKSDERIRRSADAHTFVQQFSTEPGKYRVEAIVVDLDSGKGTKAISQIRVPEPAADEPELTHVKLSGIEDNADAESPLTAYALPSRLDSLRFEYKISRPQEEGEADLQMRLIRFESDKKPPRRLSAPQPSSGSIEYRGIDYSSREIVTEQIRTLVDEHGTIEFEYTMPLPERGAYRFEVSMIPEDEDEGRKLRKARDFAVASRNFPEVKSVREMAQALTYLMPESEHEELMAIEDEDSLKYHMDKFWLENLEDEILAKRVVEKYYDRVEEANRRFTNFKEGWMTDMGMIYILFGPPPDVSRRTSASYIHSGSGLVWRYPHHAFTFDHSRRDSDHYPFDHYVLLRSFNYFQDEYQQKQRWLTGVVLTRPY